MPVAGDVVRGSPDPAPNTGFITRSVMTTLVYAAMLDGRALAAAPDLDTVLDRLLDRFGEDGRSFVQVLRGEGAPAAEEIQSRIEARGMETDVKWGGQPHYPLLLSAE